MTCCASFLFRWFCVVLCSALQLQSSSTMLLQCLCTESEVCTRMGYELLLYMQYIYSNMDDNAALLGFCLSDGV